MKHWAGVALRSPVSPHLAARRDGVTLCVPGMRQAIDAVRWEADRTLVELPGGLFTPLTDDYVNADLARMLASDALLLAAPDRLGVLHDVIATTRAADAMGVSIRAIVLIEPEESDASTGSNAAELTRFVRLPVLGTLP